MNRSFTSLSTAWSALGPKLSEVTPTDARGTGRAAESTGTPRLSDEAERIFDRRGRLRAGKIARRVAQLNQQGEPAAVRRENEIIIGSLRSKIAERYGPSIAERSIRDLRSATLPHRRLIDRRAVADGFQIARSIDEELRARPEVRRYLPGSDRFRTLARQFDLTSEVAVRNYERSLNDALAACQPPLTPARVAAFAEVAASESAEFRVRRVEESRTDYRAFSARISAGLNKPIRMGWFVTRGIGPTDTFANFIRIDLRKTVARDPRHIDEMTAGDKVHVSVTKEDLPSAWAVLQPLLLAEDNPFPGWKMTILENVNRRIEMLTDQMVELERKRDFTAARAREEILRSDIRASEGMQFTLYPYSRFEDPEFIGDGPAHRHFLTLLEWALTDARLRPGTTPESDTVIEGLSFLTFRNERVSSRGAEVGEAHVTPEMTTRLQDLPFYRAINKK